MVTHQIRSQNRFVKNVCQEAGISTGSPLFIYIAIYNVPMYVKFTVYLVMFQMKWLKWFLNVSFDVTIGIIYLSRGSKDNVFSSDVNVAV